MLRGWFIEQMAMYAAYHTKKANQATHYIGVPVLTFALLALLAKLPVGAVGPLPVTGATVLLAVVLAVYLLAEPWLGLAAAAFYLPVLALAEFTAGLATGSFLAVLAAAIVIGIGFQAWGHKIEGRRPALVDNRLQIFMAPSFLLAEWFFAAGRLPELERAMAERSPRYAAAVRRPSA